MGVVDEQRVEFRIQGPRPPLTIEFDSGWRAVYLRFHDGEVRRSEEVQGGVVLDRGSDDRILGVEIVGLEPQRCAAVLEALRRVYLHEVPALAAVEVVAA